MKAIYTDLNTGEVIKEVQYNVPHKSDCDEYINEYEYAMAENQILGIINELYKIGYPELFGYEEDKRYSCRGERNILPANLEPDYGSPRLCYTSAPQSIRSIMSTEEEQAAITSLLMFTEEEQAAIVSILNIQNCSTSAEEAEDEEQ